MDQALTYILSAVGILGFYLAGKKVWWSWYVNIANQLIWLFFSVITQQWGFLLATAFYFAVFSKNAYQWTKEHFAKKRELDGVADSKVTTHFLKRRFKDAESEDQKVPAEPEKGPERGPVGPPEAVSDYIRLDGTDPEVSNEIAFVVTDVMKEYVSRVYPDFALRYGIAHELQRRLDVKLKGTRPDVARIIQREVEAINVVLDKPLFGNEQREISLSYALGSAKRLLTELLIGEVNAKQTGSSESPRDSDRDS